MPRGNCTSISVDDHREIAAVDGESDGGLQRIADAEVSIPIDSG